LYTSEQKLGWQQYTTTAQISDFLTFWGTCDFVIAVSSQSRGKRIACVAARAAEILPKRAGKSFASASSYSFYFITVFNCL